MTDLVRRLIVWVGLMAAPRGRHRRAASPPLPSFASPTFPADAPLPAHRSPYGMDALIDGAAIVAVRPYLVAHEQGQRRREAVVLAAQLSARQPHWPQGVEVA